MDVTWIETTDALEAWIGGCRHDTLAVDTEADSFHHYREKICLVQLTSGERHALVDPLAGVDLAALAGPLADPSVRKLFHGADYDVRLLQRDFGLDVHHLYDTSIAARLTGESAIGLAALLEKYLGVILDKSHQRADWSKRPLSEGMRAYAVADTSSLEALAAILDENARGLGRDGWIREECVRLESVRWRGRRDDDPEPFRRVKGSAALDRHGLSVLRELWTWRDETARRRDRPAFRVFRDETLLALAKAPPAAIGDLARATGFPAPLLRSPSAVEIVDAARRGSARPETEWPERKSGTRPQLDPAIEARVDGIKAQRDKLAGELALDPAVLASRAVVEEMAKRFESGEDPWSVPDLRRWQAELLRPHVA